MAGAMRRMGMHLGSSRTTTPVGTGVTTPGSPTTPTTTAGTAGTPTTTTTATTPPTGTPTTTSSAEDVPAAREPEPLPVRRDRAARPMGLAPAGASAGLVFPRGAMGSGPVGATAAKLAVREPIAAVVEPAPARRRLPALPDHHAAPAHLQRGADHRRAVPRRHPVIMNLTEMDDADAKRLLDFSAELSFGLRGSIERVTAKVFLLSPQNVNVTAEDKAQLREGGFFNQS